MAKSNAKDRLRKKKEKRKKILIAIVITILFIVVSIAIYSVLKPEEKPAEFKEPEIKAKYIEENGDLIIDVSTIDDNELHFFGYNHNETNIVFFIVSGTDNKLHVAFNICTYGPCLYECKGFTKAGTHVKCNSAGCTYPINCINTDEDSCCIPLDIEFEETDDSIIVKVEDIKEAEKYYHGRIE